MFDVDEPISDYQKVIRERASQSLGPLRYTFNSPVNVPSSKKSGYAGKGYLSAVTRLKTLLQRYEEAKVIEPRNSAVTSNSGGILNGEGFSSERSVLPDTREVTELLDNQFTILQYLEGQVEFYKDALESLKQRTELVVNENETLFDHLKTKAVTEVLASENQPELEDEMQSVGRGNTSDVLTQRSTRRVDEGVKLMVSAHGDEERAQMKEATETLIQSEKHRDTGQRDKNKGVKEWDPDDSERSTRNSFLRKEQPTGYDFRRSLMPNGVYTSAFESSFGMGSLDSMLFMSANERKFVNQLEEEVEKIRKLHEAKTKHLETLLYSTRDELEDSQRQVSELQNKLRAQKLLIDQSNQPALCVKCGQETALLSNSHSDAAIQTINKLSKERDDLMNTLTEQKEVLGEVRQREFEAYSQVKNSCHMVEQAQLEKAEAIIHVRQLREDLHRERERHEQYMKLSSEKMGKERQNIRDACRAETDKLNKQLEASSEASAALENQLERLTREKVDLATELEKAKSQIMAHTSEIEQVGANVQQELEQTRMKLLVAHQEINSMKTTAQQSQRERELEKSRASSEIEILRRRLQEAEKTLVESKEDCLRLTERVDIAEREVKRAEITMEKQLKSKAEQMENLTEQNKQREDRLNTMLHETESRHSQYRTELQQMLESEMQVCNQMKEECKRLTQQLQDSSEKARSRLQEANLERATAKQKLEESSTERRMLEEQNTKKDKKINELSARLKQSDENARKQVDQMCELLAARNNLLKERKILSQEVEFLRKQWMSKMTSSGHATPVDTASHASTEQDEEK
ncbi:serologically defined colon cancer antigen 8 homolog [Montipora foliosa]|uniref:serologically defined colon cancer antigen 8 homolog n=1 Tax=Montipora foliosa TaxID=591990 RepID=UPI0035F18207